MTWFLRRVQICWQPCVPLVTGARGPSHGRRHACGDIFFPCTVHHSIWMIEQAARARLVHMFEIQNAG